MSVLTQRGGVPRVQRLAIDTTGRKVTLGANNANDRPGTYRFTSQHLQVISDGAFEGRLYFTQKDFDDGVNYIVFPSASRTVWEGPAELKDIWVRGVGGTVNLEIVAFQRLG